MQYEEILRAVDHTCLSPMATWEDIRRLCDEGVAYHTASVCIPPYFVRAAADYLGGRLPVCTVVGFPNGYETTAAKLAETEDALRAGADEIDTVICGCAVRMGDDEAILRELRAQRELCGDRILKVIIETCRLSEDEKIRMCEVVSASGADFIKTSTGFGGGGATRADVALLRAHVAPQVRVKAAGGISTIADAEDFLALGAARLGTSRIVALIRQKEEEDANA